MHAEIPNVVRVFDAFKVLYDGKEYGIVAMQKLTQLSKRFKKINPTQFYRLMKEAANALYAMHT